MQSEHTLYAISLLEAKLVQDNELRETLIEEVGEDQLLIGTADIAFILLMMSAQQRGMEPAELLKAIRTTAIVKSNRT